MEKYYSQNGEDYLLREFFKEKKDGFYIDVGAFDGIHLSNTFLFEKLGWKGVCVEAHPQYYQKCKENRPLSQCLHAACVGDENVNEITFQTEELGLLSGIQRKDEADIKKRYAGRGLEFKGFQEVTVPATTLNRVLESYGDSLRIDFISIDVEGNELEVLNGFDLKQYKPEIILVEANTAADEEKLDSYLINQQGYYKARRLVENIFYCRDAGSVERIQNVKIKSFHSGTDHPLGKEFNPPPTILHGLLAILKVNFIERIKTLWKRLF